MLTILANLTMLLNQTSPVVVGDAAQLTALLVQSEVSLANLGSFTVDELAATGIGEAAACELLSQFKCRGMGR